MVRVSGRTLWTALLAGLIGWSATIRAETGERPAPLILEQTVLGLTSPADAGMPGKPVMLMDPASVAATGEQLVVFDRSKGELHRIDPRLLTAERLARSRPLANWRLRPTRSTDFLVIDPHGTGVRAFSESGELRGHFEDLELTQAVDATVSVTGNELIVADVDGRLHTFAWSGVRISTNTTLSDRGVSPVALVRGPRTYFLIDRDCTCVIELDGNGLPLRLIAEGQLPLATDLAVDAHGRLWLLDSAGQHLYTLLPSEQVQAIPVHTLGVASVSALTIDRNRLILAERGSGRLLIFAIADPGGVQ